MATFRCLKSSDTLNANTGADLGSTTTSTHTLLNTPILAGTLEGTIYDGSVAIQTFSVNSSGTFAFVDIGSPSPKVTAGTINLGTGVMTFTWGTAPGTNSALVSYTGSPIYENVTMLLFYAQCHVFDRLCNRFSNAYVASVTVCRDRLYTQ